MAKGGGRRKLGIGSDIRSVLCRGRYQSMEGALANPRLRAVGLARARVGARMWGAICGLAQYSIRPTRFGDLGDNGRFDPIRADFQECVGAAQR